MVRLVEVKSVSIGQRLEELLKEGIQNGRFRNQFDFCKQFSDWVEAYHLSESFKLSSTMFSRWTSGRVIPRRDKINLFAEYFNVNPEWIACEADRTEYRTEPTEEQRKLFKKLNKRIKPYRTESSTQPTEEQRETWKEWDKTITPSLDEEMSLWDGFSDFQKYLSAIGYRLEECPIRTESVQDTFRTYKDGKEYTWNVESDVHTDYRFSVTLPDHSKVYMTTKQVEQMLKRIKSQIGLEFNMLKGEQG